MTAITPAILDKLSTFDTPTICNLIELFEVRPRQTGYMDARIQACFPEMPPMVVRAVFWMIPTSTATLMLVSVPDPEPDPPELSCGSVSLSALSLKRSSIVATTSCLNEPSFRGE